MRSFTPPVRDLALALDVVGLDDVIALPAFGHVDRSTVHSLLEEFGRLMADQWGDLNQPADRAGVRVDPSTATVAIAPGFHEAYRALVEGGWTAVSAPQEHGGGGFPHVAGMALAEMMGSACMSLQLCPMLTQAAIEAIGNHGTPAQQERYLSRLVTGEWSGTMQLTEPDAGSDVGALHTKAVEQPDGSWRITGQKIYITWGEHSMAENIVHVVLARREGAPPGTKGISCFIVPKFLVGADGSLGARNDVKVLSVEHKMGIHASPTCVMSYGDDGEGAVAELIGEVDAGMRTMFIMMNNARLAVGQQGVSVGERAYQVALEHATTRVQGRTLTGAPTIVGHPDVARMLMLMRSQLDAARLLVLLDARAVDESRHADGDARVAAQERADLLTPLTKSWCTDLGVELTSLGVQIGGGMGYCEDTGAAQLYRDARILPIYEGTNGIQALDLVNRKLPMRKGAVVAEVLDEIRGEAARLEASAGLEDLAAPLRAAADAASGASAWMLDALQRDVADAHAGATAYCRLLATVVGGGLMARQALVAAGRAGAGGGPDADTDADDDGWLAAKQASARFFMQQVLPTVGALAAQATAGAAATLAVARSCSPRAEPSGGSPGQIDAASRAGTARARHGHGTGTARAQHGHSTASERARDSVLRRVGGRRPPGVRLRACPTPRPRLLRSAPRLRGEGRRRHRLVVGDRRGHRPARRDERRQGGRELVVVGGGGRGGGGRDRCRPRQLRAGGRVDRSGRRGDRRARRRALRRHRRAREQRRHDRADPAP